MFIKELELFGFKSFKDKTTLRFAPGMNCIVGPNGCGKSNILDALRWVLGEQSFAVLRCSKNEDLIFAGTARVPPLNYAEVRLVLSVAGNSEINNAWWQGQTPSEIEIRRRFFRSGESEYYLNRQPCRLRDIQDLFLSHGIGTKAYSTFDLHQIREIISGNIRKMFEEAATLAKFRDAKEECQRKIELTNADLTRLEDIISERERITRSLQRQAAKLRAYQRLKEEEKRLRLWELKQTYEILKTELEKGQKEIAVLEQVQADRLNEIRRLEKELHNLRTRLLAEEGEKEHISTELQQLRQAILELQTKEQLAEKEKDFLLRSIAEWEKEQNRLKEEIKNLEGLSATLLLKLKEMQGQREEVERQLAERRSVIKQKEDELFQIRQNATRVSRHLQELMESAEKLRRMLTKLAVEEENLKGHWQRVQEDIGRVKGRIKEVENELKVAEIKREQAQNPLTQARQQLLNLREELKTQEGKLVEVRGQIAKLLLEKSILEQKIDSLQLQVKTVQLEEAKKLWGEEATAVLEFLEPAPGWERACEAVLYFLLDFLVVNRSVANRLSPIARGKNWRLLIKDISPQETVPIIPFFSNQKQIENILQDKRIVGKLTEFVKVKPDSPLILSYLLDSFLVPKDYQVFQELIDEYPHGAFVMQEGAAWFGDGRLMVMGESPGVLTAEVQFKETRTKLNNIKTEIDHFQKSEKELQEKQEKLQRELEKTESKLLVEEQEVQGLISRIKILQTLWEELKREKEHLIDEEKRLKNSLEKVAMERQIKGKENERLAQEIAAAETELKQLENAAVEIEGKVKIELKDATELLASLTEYRAQIERLIAEMGHNQSLISDKQHRWEELKTTIEEAKNKIKHLEEEKERRCNELKQLKLTLATNEEQLAHFSTKEISRATETLEANWNELREIQDKGQAVLLEQRLRVAEIEARFKAVINEAQTSYKTDIVHFTFEEPTPDEEQLQRIRERLEALGEVNPLALEEYEQERKDLERLLFQRNDVFQAKENLQQALLEIDRHAKEQFLATYQAVRQEFQLTFKELFLSGEADLILANEINPLESEVEIIAKPRGKTPKRLEQLSDGEKAMLAIALLLAFYRVKPAPFCFLDEVDAPLDDANVIRFADYLKRLSEKTQVILITHNRATIERADVLFGVTAEEPGVSQLVSVNIANYRERISVPINKD
ncbi:MAG: chromosome segregation protein SMC [candidate division WOR-3 bacterium]